MEGNVKQEREFYGKEMENKKRILWEGVEKQVRILCEGNIQDISMVSNYTIDKRSI